MVHYIFSYGLDSMLTVTSLIDFLELLGGLAGFSQVNGFLLSRQDNVLYGLGTGLPEDVLPVIVYTCFSCLVPDGINDLVSQYG